MLHQIKIIDIQGYEFQGLILQQDLSVAKLLAMAPRKVVYTKYAKQSLDIVHIFGYNQGGNTLRRRNEAKRAQFLPVFGRLAESRA